MSLKSRNRGIRYFPLRRFQCHTKKSRKKGKIVLVLRQSDVHSKKNEKDNSKHKYDGEASFPIISCKKKSISTIIFKVCRYAKQANYT